MYTSLACPLSLRMQRKTKRRRCVGADGGVGESVVLVGYRTVRDGGLYFLPAFPIIIIVADFLVLLIRRGDGWSRRRNRGSVRQDATGMTWHGIASHRIASRRIASHCTAPHRTAPHVVLCTPLASPLDDFVQAQGCVKLGLVRREHRLACFGYR